MRDFFFHFSHNLGKRVTKNKGATQMAHLQEKLQDSCVIRMTNVNSTIPAYLHPHGDNYPYGTHPIKFSLG